MAKVSGISTEKIIDVAEAMISAKGIRNTSLKDIAKALGISKGTLYYHYPTREALVYDIAGRHFERVRLQFQNWYDRTGRRVPGTDMLAAILEAILQDVTGIGPIHLYLLQEAVGNEDLRKRFADRHREWRDMIAHMLKMIFAGTEELHRSMADMLLALLEGSIMRRQVEEMDMDFRTIAGYVSGYYTRQAEEKGKKGGQPENGKLKVLKAAMKKPAAKKRKEAESL